MSDNTIEIISGVTPAQAQNASPSVSGIVMRTPEELKPWPNNPRSHSEKQITKLMASISKFTFTSAVLIDEEDTILSGHGRVRNSTVIISARI